MLTRKEIEEWFQIDTKNHLCKIEHDDFNDNVYIGFSKYNISNLPLLWQKVFLILIEISKVYNHPPIFFNVNDIKEDKEKDGERKT